MNDELLRQWRQMKKTCALSKECNICGDELLFNKWGRSESRYDHSHFTGKYRGTLCNKCNVVSPGE